MIWGVAIFFVTIIVDLWTDYRLWYKNIHRSKESVNHVVGGALRTAALVLSVIFLGWWSIPMVLFVYWALFDTVYGSLIGHKWPFIGTSSMLDILQRQYPILIFIKYAGAVGFTVLYFLME